MTSLACGICGLMSCWLLAADDVPRKQVKLNGHVFTLAADHTIEQIAGPPLADRPICADFDERGRLYVADSSGFNDKAPAQLEKKPHRIVRLEDADGDGRFDKSTVFADRMMFPEGTLWHDGSLYVAAPPEIWKLTDDNDDGTADRREVWFDGKTLTGCANDLHGPYLGPDGWIYWCKGAFAEQIYERAGKPPLVTKAAHIFRRRPEGGEIEAVMTGGMDNPVEVAFTRGGERIFTTTFLQNPANGLRDGLIHAVYGGVYGKVQNATDGHPRTGDLMPVLSHLGAAAPCGLMRVESDYLGKGYRDNLLACSFNMRKLTRHELSSETSLLASKDTDFLVSDNLDFHPTDVLEDADGSLLVIDTGGWYKMCCPTSQMPKPDVLGAIYRVRKKGSPKIDDPRGQKLAWTNAAPKELAARLGDERFAVRRRATAELAKLGSWSVGPLQAMIVESGDANQRVEGVWALTHIDAASARSAVRKALHDADPVVQQAALNSVSLWRDQKAKQELLAILDSAPAIHRRLAAEALGRIGAKDAIPALLSLAGSQDRGLNHAGIFAVIDIGEAALTRHAMATASLAGKCAALVALDQMPGNKSDREEIVPLLTHEIAGMKAAAWWIAERHPEWAPDLVNVFRQTIATEKPPHTELTARLSRFAANPAIQEVIAAGLAGDATSKEMRLSLLSAMHGSKLKSLPAVWREPLVKQMVSPFPPVQEAAVATVNVLSGGKPGDELVPSLIAAAANVQATPKVRLQALAAVPPGKRKLATQDVQRICGHLNDPESTAVRSLAADVLVTTPLSAEQLHIVVTALPSVGPMELKRLMELFAKQNDAVLGAALAAALYESPAASALPADVLKQQLSSYGENVLKNAQPLFDRIARDNQEKTSRLEEVLALLPHGDVRRGQQVFHGAKTACAACHAMGYLGGKIGPDLTHIGKIRSDRDLLESVLFPSASFVRSYEPVTIVTLDGVIKNGLIREETAAEITLQLDAEKSVRINAADIEQRAPSTLSIMPAGLEKQLTPQQLADLIAYLKASL